MLFAHYGRDEPGRKYQRNAAKTALAHWTSRGKRPERQVGGNLASGATSILCTVFARRVKCQRRSYDSVRWRTADE